MSGRVQKPLTASIIRFFEEKGKEYDLYEIIEQWEKYAESMEQPLLKLKEKLKEKRSIRG